MNSKRRLALAVALTAFVLTGLSAEEVVFTSLTRRPLAPKAAPTNVSIITREEIEETGAQTLEEILELTPSVDVSRSGSIGSFASIRLRGVPTSNQVQIVIDDQPLGGVAIQALDVAIIPVDKIESIEIVRGGASVLYGANTIGGVIHIKTRQAEGEKGYGEIKTQAGSFATHGVSVTQGVKTDRVNFNLTGGGYESDGYQQNSEVDHRNLFSSVRWALENGLSLGAEVEYMAQEQGSPSGTPVPFSEWNGELEKRPNTPTNSIEKTYDRQRVHLAVPVPGGVVKSVGYRGVDTYKLFSSPTSSPLSDYRNTILGLDSRYLGPKGFTFGASTERDERRSQGQIPRHISNWGLYAQQEIALGRLYAAPALRLDQHSEFGNEWNPRLSLVYQLTDAWKVSGNAARSFRAPTLVDLFIVSTNPSFPAFDFFGNPNLKPEIAWNYDLGLEWGQLGGPRVAVTGFFTRIRDRISAVDTDGNGNNDTLQNTSKAEIAGVETEVSLKTGILDHALSYTAQRAKGTTVTSSDFVNLRLTPRHMGNYRLRLQLPAQLAVINNVQYVSKQRQFDGDGGLTLPSYGLWDIRLEKDLSVFQFWFQAKNLTDKIYTESITFGNFVPMPGRTFWGGVTVKLGA